MQLLLYLFTVTEANSCRGLPPELRGHYAIMLYRFLLSAALEGDRTVRAKGPRIGRTKDGPVDPEKATSLLGDSAAAYIARVRKLDPKVAAMLVPADPLDGDDATYSLMVPDLAAEGVAAINARIDEASRTCQPMCFPDDVEAAWRVVFSEEAARRGIDFPAVRPASTS